MILLTAIYIWSAYGLGPLLRWGTRRARRQVASLGSLVARALPLLLLFNTFLFINAEVWEVAGTLTGLAYVIIIATFFGLGATFALSRVPGILRAANRFESWPDIDRRLTGTPAAPFAPVGADDPEPNDPLRLRQRLNMALLVLFGQALQITLVTAALIVS